ncbi:MAG TPA: glycosyltransferase family 2 protein [Thermoplasmata archaeon]|nr:glycosyltransferase family 2 protein [Thermoplasmata archaeon]
MPAPSETLPPVDVLMATFNSARDLDECLTEARARLPVARLIVVDRNSTDATVDIARRHGAEVRFEEVGLGYARSLALSLATTENVLFLDSDVILRRADFYERALGALRSPRVAAVVGCGVGHRFLYGLPLGLTLLRRAWARGVAIAPTAQGAETYYLRRALRAQHLRVAYVPDAMEHRSIYRVRNWPEWQGAQLRRAAGWSPYELTNALAVVLLIALNTRRPRSVLLAPAVFGKLLRGYLAPDRWGTMDRRVTRPIP